MTSVSEAFYDILHHHGVCTLFGNPGSNELPFLKGLPEEFRYYMALQEGAAIAMADAYAQASGTIGFVNLHAASGTGNAMGCLTNAAAAHSPLMVMAGQQARRYVPLEAMLTNVDATKLCDPLVKWSAEPLRPQDVPQLASTGLLYAQAAPTGPVYLSVPLDDWEQDAEDDSLRHLSARAVTGDPVVADAALEPLIEALNTATNPALVLGPGADTDEGFPAAVRLAEAARLSVFTAPSAPRAPFPTRHANYDGVLPSAVGDLAAKIAGHDVVLTFGAAIFRYHHPSTADYLPEGTRLFGVTADPHEAARAPVGHLVVGDPSDALARLAERAVPGDRSEPARRHLDAADTSGPEFSTEAILDAVDRGKSDDTVIAFEWTSADQLRDRLTITRPGSLYYPASGGLGWGLPAAIGLRLADPTRPVVALIGDGALQYTPSALWTAAQYQVPVTFVVARNGQYSALEMFSRLLDTPPADYLDLPGIDAVKAAEAYGVPARRVTDLDELADLVHAGTSASGPSLIEVPQRAS